MIRITGLLGELKRGKRMYAVFALCAATAIATPAQTFTVLVDLGSDGYAIDSALTQGADGYLYGTASGYGSGTVFKMTAAGDLTVLYRFCSLTNCTDGSAPTGGLVQGANGDFYGTTSTGGANNGGTVFKITPGGSLTTLYSFCAETNCADGSRPNGLVQAPNGELYGTTNLGGANSNAGTVFKITGGELTTLYNFCSQANCADGSRPIGTLVRGTGGNFYGATNNGPASGTGTVFEINPEGALTTLCTVAGRPDGTLLQGPDGSLYGASPGAGTVFRVTPEGVLRTVATVGGKPLGGVMQGSDGNLYGTTSNSGSGGEGTIFEIVGSSPVTVYNFCSQNKCKDGAVPKSGLMQDTNGNFYGTTFTGGTTAAGVIFSLDMGLGPFVEAQPTSGAVGAAVRILGTDLTGAASVSFNGAAAVFDVVSSSEIITTVPAGATSGKVQVVTPSGALMSNVAFRVLP